MKTSVILLASLAVTGLALAETPKKAPITKYSRLWTDSPFTSKPPPVGPAEVANALDDYALLGVSPIPEGYRVTLMNKKNPEERVSVDSGKTVEGFKIVEVTRKAGDPLGTVVRMMSGSLTGTVAFDEKLLTLKTAAPVKPGQQQGAQPGQPGGPQIVPGQPQPQPQPQGGQNHPAPSMQQRPRVVPPPTTGAAPAPQTQGGPNAGGGRSNRADRRGGR